jgi:hypothetical protein
MSRVWLSPNAGSRDLLWLFQHPETWPEAKKRVDVLQLIQWQVTHVANPLAGPNTAEPLLNCVPGGAFKWLADNGIELAFEAGVIKEYSCQDSGLSCVRALQETLSIVRGSGGRAAHIVMDEPFVSALPAPPGGCGWTAEHTARAVRDFVDAIHVDEPTVEIGMVEAYPEDSYEKVLSFAHALRDVGHKLPFLHVDIDYYRVKREHSKIDEDLRSLQSGLKQVGIRFGAVVWGEHGTSNSAYCADASVLAQAIHSAIGFDSQDDIVFQSWSRTPQGELLFPENLPETDHTTHTGLLLTTLQKFGVEPEPKEVH